MVMGDPVGAAQYDAAGETLLAPLHEFVASSIGALTPEGGRVLDLGCGSARLLARLAIGRPDVVITGVDLSGSMLALGEMALREAGVADRVDLVRADITDLPDEVIGRPSVVSCSLTLHHLGDGGAARACLRELSRARARADGGVWIFDFARLGGRRAWPVLLRMLGAGSDRFRLDAINSERAAFTQPELGSMLAASGLSLRAGRTRPLPVFQAHWAGGAGTRTSTPPAYRPTALPRGGRLRAQALRRAFDQAPPSCPTRSTREEMPSSR
jgi:SAM-dependent methyltransferase